MEVAFHNMGALKLFNISLETRLQRSVDYTLQQEEVIALTTFYGLMLLLYIKIYSSSSPKDLCRRIYDFTFHVMSTQVYGWFLANVIVGNKNARQTQTHANLCNIHIFLFLHLYMLVFNKRPLLFKQYWLNIFINNGRMWITIYHPR